jgi:tetratricopeptide (TPR) repeat protein
MALLALLAPPGCSLIPKVMVLDDPLSKEEHLELGLSYEKDGDLDLALREYQAADPLPMAILGTGNVLFVQGDHKRAEQAYRKAIRLYGDPSAMNNLAYLILLEGRDLQEAASLAERAVEEGIRRDLSDQEIRNFKSTYNQAETALGRSQVPGGGEE